MTLMEEIARMQSSGMRQEQIINNLKAKGIPEQEIMNALSQSQIKQAVAGSEQTPFVPSPSAWPSQLNPVPPNQFPGTAPEPPKLAVPEPLGSQTQPFPQQSAGFGGGLNPPSYSEIATQNSQQQENPYGGGFNEPPAPGQNWEYLAQPASQYGQMPEGEVDYSGMQPSIMSQQQERYEQVGGEYEGAGTIQDPYSTEMYQPYQETLSADLITEISEQIVSERLAALQDKIEKILDMRTIVEANMINLNDRLKRMEKIVDQMQVSILKKVGEYLTDIQDVKKELEETQKSFIAIQKSKNKNKK